VDQKADKEVERKPIEAHNVKKGKYVMLKGKPCKIIEVKTSKTGKHGHMKCGITGLDVLTGKKVVENCPGHENMTEFTLDKKEYQLVNVSSDDKQLQCLSDDSSASELFFAFDPDSDTGKSLAADFDAGKALLVTIIKAPVGEGDNIKDEEVLESYKEDKNTE
jgi:translation initiation factor 5A